MNIGVALDFGERSVLGFDIIEIAELLQISLEMWRAQAPLKQGEPTCLCVVLATERIEHIAFATDAGIAARARIGLIVLASDHTIEHEFRRVLTAPGVALYQARIRNSPRITPETLAAIYTSGEEGEGLATTSFPDFVDLRARNSVFKRAALR